ncbi:MAG TPA: YHS domain-containing protein [Fimbriimonas sp.]
MKKTTYLALAILSVTAAAFAQTKPATKAPTELECPIMKGHKVNIAKAVKDNNFADYKGRRYVFCCGGCKPAFQKDPAKYAKAPSIPAPAKKKA